MTRKSNGTKEFDIHPLAVHHDSVKSPARATLLLLAAILLTWHGVLISTPHSHADRSVPQEELACSASSPSSQNHHLHDSGRLRAPRPCLACLAGPTSAEVFGVAGLATSAAGKSTSVTVSPDLRSRLQTQLPLLRGPPART